MAMLCARAGRWAPSPGAQLSISRNRSLGTSAQTARRRSSNRGLSWACLSQGKAPPLWHRTANARGLCFVCRAENDDLQLAISQVERARNELEELMVERQEAEAAAKKNASKAERFMGTLKLLEAEALTHVGRDDTQAARRALQQRDIVQKAAEKAERRADVNKMLADKLKTIIGSKEVEVISLLDLARRVAQRGDGGGAATNRASDAANPVAKQVRAVDIEEAFLELERSSLESLLYASSQEDEEAQGGEPASKHTPEPCGPALQTQGQGHASEAAAPSCVDQGAVDPREEEGDGIDTGNNASSVWWTLGLAAMQEGDTLPIPNGEAALLPEQPAVEGGFSADMVKTEAASLIRKIVNARTQGKDIQAGDLARLVAMSLLSAGQHVRENEEKVQASNEPSTSARQPETVGGVNYVDTVAKIAGERPRSIRMSIFRVGADEAVAAALSGAPPHFCRGFVVSLAAIMDVDEGDATKIVSELVLHAVRQRLLSTAVELQQDTGLDEFAVPELLGGAANALMAFPPALPADLGRMASDLQSFIPGPQREAMLKVWKSNAEGDPQAAEWGDRILGSLNC